MLLLYIQVLNVLGEVQRAWSHLESIFIASEDIRKNLPQDAARFDKIDKDFKVFNFFSVINISEVHFTTVTLTLLKHPFLQNTLKKMYKTKNVVESTNQPGILADLEKLQEELAVCEKALADYLETKRLAFPRFYFVSSVDLLDILSNGNEPEQVARHLAKLFDAMAKLDFKQGGQKKEKKEEDGEDKKSEKKEERGEKPTTAIGMRAKDGEKVPFSRACECTGPVELWLCKLEDTMRATVRHFFSEACSTYDEKPRDAWIQDFPAQTALCGTQIGWTTEVNSALGKLEEGYENALKDYHRKQVNQLNTLIGLLLGQLSAQERQKIMTICTIDVHSRDVVLKLIALKIETAQAFPWQSQLRHRWDSIEGDCYGNICDAQFKYWYEYLGNTPRLVITPLTDRCYITLTQSLHLIMGGAPAGI